MLGARTALALLSMVAMASCHRPPSGELDPRVAIAVEVTKRDGDRLFTLSRAEVDEALARARLESDREATELHPDAKRALLETLIDERLAHLAIVELGPASVSTAAVAREMTAVRRDARDKHPGASVYRTDEDLARSIRARLEWSTFVADTAATSTPSEAQVLARARTLKHPEQVRAAQIVVETEELGRKLVKQLKAGEDFEALARAHSVAPEASQGGRLGWFARGEMPHVIEEACFALTPGATSEVVASTSGYHVFRVLDRRSAGPLPADEARHAAARALRAESRARAERTVRTQLRAAAKIRYVPEVLRPLGVPLEASELSP